MILKPISFVALVFSFFVFSCDFSPADVNPSSGDPPLGNVVRNRVDRNVLDVVISPPENVEIRVRMPVTFSLLYNAMRNRVVMIELDSDGDGDFDRFIDGHSIRITAFYYEPGEYEPVIRVTDEAGYYSVASCRVIVTP